jgi:hypothetical protein
MKKLAITASILMFFLFSCKKPPMLPPSITVFPEDSIIQISPVKPDTFRIKAFSNEDLYKLEIYTNPNIYSLDSVFPTFTHSLDFSIIISVGDQIQSLPEDSIIKLKFTLRDHYMFDTVVKYLKLVSGYGKISEDSAELSYGHDSAFFYSFESKVALTFNNIQKKKFDLIFIDDTSGSNGFILCSPDAFYPSNKLSEIAYNYNATDQNHTKINGFATDYSDIDAKFLYNLDISDGYINDNEGDGGGHAHLKKGDILAFQLASGRKGVLKVTKLDSAKLKIGFVYKIQDANIKQ